MRITVISKCIFKKKKHILCFIDCELNTDNISHFWDIVVASGYWVGKSMESYDKRWQRDVEKLKKQNFMLQIP